jgi:hypothetical protein
VSEINERGVVHEGIKYPLDVLIQKQNRSACDNPKKSDEVRGN